MSDVTRDDPDRTRLAIAAAAVLGLLVGFGVWAVVSDGDDPTVVPEPSAAPSPSPGTSAAPSPSSAPSPSPSEEPSPAASPSPAQGEASALVDAIVAMDRDALDQAGATVVDDAAGDHVYSRSDRPAGRTDAVADIAHVTSVTTTVEDDFAQRFPCGRDDASVKVRCTDGELSPGSVSLFALTLQGAATDTAIPGQAVHALVVRADDDPDNDWTAKDGFDWDYFIGTDLWFELASTPSEGRFDVEVSRVDQDQQILPTAEPVVVLVIEDTIVFVLPEQRAPRGTPFRMSAFVTDGSYEPDASGGDVPGPDPTGPLLVH